MDEENKKRKILTIEIDDEVEAALQERMDYLSQKQRYRRITKSDAVRHALLNTAYKRTGKKGTEEEV